MEVNKTNILVNLKHEILSNEYFGVKNMAWNCEQSDGLFEYSLNLDWLSSQPLLPYLVQVIPTYILYKSLIKNGFDDSLEVIEHIKDRQLQRILDYDLWEKNVEIEEYEIVPFKVFNWFRIWLEIGSDFAAERIMELSEEVLVALFSSILEIIPIGLNEKLELNEDDYFKTLDERFFLKLKDQSDKGYYEIFIQVIHSLYEVDAKYIQSILSYSAMLVRHENLEIAQKLREARLNDDGFIMGEDAYYILKTYTIADLKALISNRVKSILKTKAVKSVYDYSVFSEFDEDIKDAIYRVFKNQNEEEILNDISLNVDKEQILLISGTLNLTNIIHEDIELIEHTVETITTKCINLFNNSMSNLKYLQNNNNKNFFEQVLQYILLNDENKIFAIKAHLVRMSNNLIFALNNKLDLDFELRALNIIKSCINIGLEYAVHDDDILNFSVLNENLYKQNKQEFAGQIILNFGLDVFFKIGWSLLFELSYLFTEELDKIIVDKSVQLQSLVWAKNYNSLRVWLSENEYLFNNSIFYVMSSILNRVPYYSNLLTITNDNIIKIKPERRCFDNLQEYSVAKSFIANISKISLFIKENHE